MCCRWKLDRFMRSGTGPDGSQAVREFQTARSDRRAVADSESLVWHRPSKKSTIRRDGNGNPAIDRARSHGRIDVLIRSDPGRGRGRKASARLEGYGVLSHEATSEIGRHCERRRYGALAGAQSDPGSPVDLRSITRRGRAHSGLDDLEVLTRSEHINEHTIGVGLGTARVGRAIGGAFTHGETVMTNAQKHAMRCSEIRQRLNEISGMEGDAFSDEIRARG